MNDLAHPGSANKQLAILCAGLALAMSPWFMSAAVSSQLVELWGLTVVELSWLIIVVQLGFVVGAVLSASVGLADRVGPRRLIFCGAVCAAGANALLLVAPGFGAAVVLRAVTGASLAVVYPPAMKAVSWWFREGKGLAFGLMVGALTIGSAVPYLVNSIGGVRWQVAVIIVSSATIIGGVAVEFAAKDGPYKTKSPLFQLRSVGQVISNRTFQLATLGYIGHMWELYAMWAWISGYYFEVFDSGSASSFAAFVTIASGAVGCAFVGWWSDRRGPVVTAGAAMVLSATFAGFIGWLPASFWPLILLVGVAWGFWVVADSAQFSAIVAESSVPQFVGTALTVQLASGFVLSTFTIFFVPLVVSWAGWGPAFLSLIIGPLVGTGAMWALTQPQFLSGSER